MRRLVAGIALLFTTPLALLGCNPFKSGETTGKLESVGQAGTWVFEKGTCESGARERYFGLIAYGPEGTGIAVKLVKDQVRGWSAVINKADTCKAADSCKALVLTADECTTLRVDVHETNTTINDVKVVEGRLDLDCKDDTSSSSIKGSLVFGHCH